jgi:adenosylcobinamide kinase/adenosylcobinamide-phosphate guanylyltransferase
LTTAASARCTIPFSGPSHRSWLSPASLRQTAATVILVSEETGWGVVPAYPLGRLFRDRLGTLTRQVGTVAGAVYLVVAGYAVDVKALGKEVGAGDF